MNLYRLSKQRPGRYLAEDLTGQGAALTGGRWNPRGMPVLYTCEHASTAVLEARVHGSGSLPVSNLFLVRLEVPDTDVARALIPDLPDDWNLLDQDPGSTVALGRQWLEAGQQLVMKVPSVVCPVDSNLLLNPQHSRMRHVKVVEKIVFEVDRRLFL